MIFNNSKTFSLSVELIKAIKEDSSLQVRALLELKADANIGDDTYRPSSPLGHAVSRCNRGRASSVEIVKLLLLEKADPNFQHRSSFSLISSAILHDKIELVNLLFIAGATMPDFGTEPLNDRSMIAAEKAYQIQLALETLTKRKALCQVIISSALRMDLPSVLHSIIIAYWQGMFEPAMLNITDVSQEKASGLPASFGPAV